MKLNQIIELQPPILQDDGARPHVGERYQTVRDYYGPRKDLVAIEDVSPWLADLTQRL